jgi:hypothetical protein
VKPGQQGIAFKVDKNGHALPKGPHEIRNPYNKGRHRLQHETYEAVVFQHSHPRRAIP